MKFVSPVVRKKLENYTAKGNLPQRLRTLKVDLIIQLHNQISGAEKASNNPDLAFVLRNLDKRKLKLDDVFAYGTILFVAAEDKDSKQSLLLIPNTPIAAADARNYRRVTHFEKAYQLLLPKKKVTKND